MAFCRSCGTDIADAAFCPRCGVAQRDQSLAVSTGAQGIGLDENAAAALSYVAGWVSGLVLLIVDKRPFVKFHAAQSIAFVITAFVGYFVALILGFILSFFYFLGLIVWLAYAGGCFATWIVLMYKAYSGEKFKLPVVGDIVAKMVGQ